MILISKDVLKKKKNYQKKHTHTHTLYPKCENVEKEYPRGEERWEATTISTIGSGNPKLPLLSEIKMASLSSPPRVISPHPLIPSSIKFSILSNTPII